MRILFIGCVQASYRELKLLLDNNKDVVGVVTKSESKFNSDFYDISPLAIEYNLPYLYVNNINENDSIEFIKKCKPDVIYCFGWSQLIKKEILNIPHMGVIGTHPTELPKNRGRHPIIWAMALGLKQTAVTFFRMNEGADTGEIIAQRIIPIFYEDYATDLYNRVEEVECELILQFTEELEKGSNVLKEQDLSQGNSWRKRSRKDGIIDWRMSSRAIYNLIRALSHPYPGAEIIHGEESIIVWKAEEVITDEYENIEPGKVVRMVSSQNFYVKAYDNLIHVMECNENTIQEGDYL